MSQGPYQQGPTCPLVQLAGQPAAAGILQSVEVPEGKLEVLALALVVEVPVAVARELRTALGQAAQLLPEESYPRTG